MADAKATETAPKPESPIAASAEVAGTLVVGGDGDGDDSYSSCFQCCVCLDLLYKPVVIACGHISCFWCVHKAMDDSQASHCALCRRRYIYFPSICQLLHHLLLKIEPVACKRRESEVLEEERLQDVYSPQLEVCTAPRSPEEIERSSNDGSSDAFTAVIEPRLPESGLMNGNCKQVSVDDVLCELCNELLFLPAVLNCGHVLCECCMSSLANGPLKCPVCESMHPGEFPNVCLDLDHFLEEQFPQQYTTRKEEALRKRAKCQHEESSSSGLQEKKKDEQPYLKDDHLLLEEDLRNVHVGVGCDSCGMYPIVGKRYKCQDCEEAIGFDLCETCYNNSSKLPGRFNQQHTPDHVFELDDSNMLCKILFRSFVMNDPYQDPRVVFIHDDDPEGHDDLPEGHDEDNNAM